VGGVGFNCKLAIAAIGTFVMSPACAGDHEHELGSAAACLIGGCWYFALMIVLGRHCGVLSQGLTTAPQLSAICKVYCQHYNNGIFCESSMHSAKLMICSCECPLDRHLSLPLICAPIFLSSKPPFLAVCLVHCQPVNRNRH
jgi:hypothetical protein